MINEYITLDHSGHDEVIINKSRFIGEAIPVETEEDALRFLQSVRARYKDATHHCYAYVIGTNAGIIRYSDDGEPGGTAGLPIMDVLKNRKVVNCCVVVTRYFGGVLLGTGGLVRAYTQGCKIAIESAGIVTMTPTCIDQCEVPYSYWDKLQYHAKSLPLQIHDVSFSTAVSFALYTKESNHDAVTDTLNKITDGKILVLPDQILYKAW